MTNPLDEVLEILDIEAIETNLFRGRSPQERQQRVFGGQVLGQALVAAGRTVEDRGVHSLHAYFLRPGDPSVPIIYKVERLRDGKSFATRRVTAVQHGRAIFALSCSYQVQEEGLEHQSEMPAVPDPDSLPSLAERAEDPRSELPEEDREWMRRNRSIDLRHVDLDEYVTLENKSRENLLWIRAIGEVPDDELVHQSLLAYASDMTLIDAAVRPHTADFHDGGEMILASLDHAMWFHRPFRANEWLLYAQESDSLSNGRGIARGRLFRRDGTLVASVVQEGLLRIRRR